MEVAVPELEARVLNRVVGEPLGDVRGECGGDLVGFGGLLWKKLDKCA